MAKPPRRGCGQDFAWHAKGIEEAGLRVDDIFYATRSSATGAWATYVEAVALEQTTPAAFPWNGSGFGNRAQGRFRRGQRPSPFDCLHPGRFWATTPGNDVDRALAALAVAASGAMWVPETLRWDPIP